MDGGIQPARELGRIHVPAERVVGRRISWARPVPRSRTRAAPRGAISCCVESAQVLRITGAADQAVEKLVYAERDIKDEKLGASIQKLQQLVPAYVSILKRIAELVASQSELLSTVATPTEVRMQALLEQMAQESTALSERATENSVAGAATMNRLRVLAGVVVVALLIGVALFGVFNIAHPIQNIGSVLVKLSAGETAVAIPYLRPDR